MATKELRTNEQIRSKQVRLIDQNGEQRGIVDIKDALAMAQEAGLDLVEVAPDAKPPVCKLINYGRYKFEQEKKQKEAKKKQKQTKLKEIRMQPKIDTHDLEFKTKHVKDFLDAGNKVKVTVRFRGRELAHTEIGRNVLEKIIELLGDGYTVERAPAMEGRFMSMVLSPKSKK